MIKEFFDVVLNTEAAKERYRKEREERDAWREAQFQEQRARFFENLHNVPERDVVKDLNPQSYDEALWKDFWLAMDRADETKDRTYEIANKFSCPPYFGKKLDLIAPSENLLAFRDKILSGFQRPWFIRKSEVEHYFDTVYFVTDEALAEATKLLDRWVVKWS